MQINGQHFTSIWQKNNEIVKIIDQRKLPWKFEIEKISSTQEMYIAIKDMHLRGAPLIGVAGAYGVCFALQESLESRKFEAIFEEKIDYLKSSRPTAVNLFYAIDRVLNAIKNITDPTKKLISAWKEADKIRDEEIENCRQIGEHGLQFIKEIAKEKNGKPVNILTHCNAGWLACVDYGTATAPIYKAFDEGIPVHVWVDETRPRNQGARLTAFELGEHGVPHTVIADNTGGHLMQNRMVDMVIVGSDRTAANGDVANKIGTYLKALAADDNQIPFYVALPTSTIDLSIEDGVRGIPVEIRNEDEVKHIEGFLDGDIKQVLLTPEKSPALNYAFDITPARYVTALITEKGICKANRESINKLLKS
jgi:methylthioribose-1-phosphate isomerase